MRRLFLVLALVGCSRSPSPDLQPPVVSGSAPEGTRSQEEVAALRDAGGSAPRMRTTPHPGASPTLRSTVGPLTRFRIVPLGEAAVAPARTTLDALRTQYVPYGFELGVLVPLPSPPPRDCAELLTRLVIGRGTVLVVPETLHCSAPFGELDAALKTAIVPLGPLGPPGPLADRRLTALVGSVVGEMLGLSTPCRDARTCCALRTAPDLAALDRRASVPCPAHAAELDRAREASGFQ
jgi:hypothetical protein